MSIAKGNLNKPADALVNLMNQLNNFTDDEKENELNLSNCKYRDTDYLKNFTKDLKRKVLSFFHMNFCSLTINFDDYNILRSDLNNSFAILAITENRIKKVKSSSINLQLNNSIEHTLTESSAGGTLVYINKRLSYQLRNDLSLYDPRKD